MYIVSTSDSCSRLLGSKSPLYAVYTFVCVCPSLAPRMGGACACVVVVRFPNEGTAKRLLNYSSTHLYNGFAQHLQEDTGWDDTWEVSPTTRGYPTKHTRGPSPLSSTNANTPTKLSSP